MAQTYLGVLVFTNLLLLLLHMHISAYSNYTCSHTPLLPCPLTSTLPLSPLGTYCHQREVEAITESISDDEGCCCAQPGHLPGILSCNKLLGMRWLAWEVVSSCYTLHGYSIAESQAHLVFNSFDYRRCYITYLIEVRA